MSRGLRGRTRPILKWSWVAGWIVYLCFIFAASAQSKLPGGPGKALVERMCKKCHTLDAITKARLTAERWGEVVEDMISRGAEGSDEEFDQVVEYLVKNFGRNKPSPGDAKTAAPALEKIRVNKAGAKELVAALGFSAEDAEAVTRYREKNGDFKEWQDLLKVSGIDKKKVEDNKDRLEF